LDTRTPPLKLLFRPPERSFDTRTPPLKLLLRPPPKLLLIPPPKLLLKERRWKTSRKPSKLLHKLLHKPPLLLLKAVASRRPGGRHRVPPAQTWLTRPLDRRGGLPLTQRAGEAQ